MVIFGMGVYSFLSSVVAVAILLSLLEFITIQFEEIIVQDVRNFQQIVCVYRPLAEDFIDIRP